MDTFHVISSRAEINDIEISSIVICVSPTVPSMVHTEIMNKLQTSSLEWRLINPRDRPSPTVNVIYASHVTQLTHFEKNKGSIILVKTHSTVGVEMATQIAAATFEKGFVVVEGYGSVLPGATSPIPAPPARACWHLPSISIQQLEEICVLVVSVALACKITLSNKPLVKHPKTENGIKMLMGGATAVLPYSIPSINPFSFSSGFSSINQSFMFSKTCSVNTMSSCEHVV